MSGAQAPFHGRVQAQGYDIVQNGGYSHPWAQNTPITAQEGLEFLVKIEEQCNQSQKLERKTAFIKAKRFVKQVGEQGGIGIASEKHSLSFQDPKRTIHNARVDIETIGKTFIPIGQSK